MKNGKVMSFGNIEDQILFCPFCGKVRLQFLAEEARVRPYNTVLAGVIARGAAKNTNADLLFGGVFRSFADRASGDVKQKLA